MSTSTAMTPNKFGQIFKLSLDTNAVVIDQEYPSGQTGKQQYIRIVGGNSTSHTITINDGSADYAPITIPVGADIVFVFNSTVGGACTIKADAAGPFNYNAFVTYDPDSLKHFS